MSKQTTWRSFDPKLSDRVLHVIETKFGFASPTPIQSRCIPLLMQHKDTVAQACTGSGKTLAFLIPAMEFLLKRKDYTDGLSTLVVAPTRELAEQIFEVLSIFTDNIPLLRPLLLVGGGSHEADVESIQAIKPTVIVGTPGRLHILLHQCAADLDIRHLDFLVLDEADRLLELGFQTQLSSIFGILPKQRRTGLFSATQTKDVDALVRAGLRNPVPVAVESSSRASSAIPTTLDNYYVEVPSAKQKFAVLCELLQKECAVSPSKTIVYVLTCAMVDYFYAAFAASRAELLDEASPSSSATHSCEILALHGQMHQKKRKGMLDKYIESKHAILFCTDVAARGLDITDVSTIIQYDAPQDPAVFVHRIGRTARAGHHGRAIVLLGSDELAYIEFLKNRKAPVIEWPHKIASCDPSLTTDTLPWSTVVLHKALLSDRDLYEKSITGFLSFVRGYKEHQLSFVFPFEKLDYGSIATAMGLLQLPQMPELKRLQDKMKPKGKGKGKSKADSGDSELQATEHEFIASFQGPSMPFSIAEIAFKDKVREAARKKKRAAEEELGKDKPAKKARTEKAESKEDEKMRKLSKKERERKHRRQEERDIDEINREAGLLKKLRQGKISKKEYEQMSGL